MRTAKTHQEVHMRSFIRLSVGAAQCAALALGAAPLAAHVVLVGGRGGIGASIAAAGSSQNPNNILSALGAMLSEGRDVAVPAGTQLAVELVSAVSLRGRGRVASANDPSTIYTSADR